MPHLFPNFRSGRALVRKGICRIAELVHIKPARNFFGESRSNILVIFRMAPCHIRTRDPHFGAECFYVRNFFLRHFVWNDKQDAITLRAGNKRQA